ncbi:hypothetical protein ACNF42_06200 [Cuniculiplasma sp. SKW3]|uniref:hypothetical protein n=1 Tax=Cuniculiplasma sp. SKW3 TaxID=3400170 RepID=UPI003FD10060
MKNRDLIIILLLLLSFLLYFLVNVFFDVILTAILILGLDLSSDNLFDKVVKKDVSSFSYSFFVLGFATSIDEISVAISSIFYGAPEIGSGALLGSSLSMIIIYSILMFLFSYKLMMRYPYYFLIFPFFLLLYLIFYYLSINLIPVYAISIIISLLIFYLVMKERRKNLKGQKVSRMSNLIFAIPMILFALLLSVATDRLSKAIDINQFLSGFLIPGTLGTIPELIVVYSALKNKMRSASEGLLTGSTIMKGTLLFPIFELFFYSTTQWDFDIILISAIVSFLFGIFIFLDRN